MSPATETRILTRDEIVDAVFNAVNQTRESDMLLGLAQILDASRAISSSQSWWTQVAARVSAVAQFAYSATYDAMQSDDFDATGDATEAAAAPDGADPRRVTP